MNHFHDLRGPAAAGSVPAASPSGDAAGAPPQGAPVVLGGQGRDPEEVVFSGSVAGLSLSLIGGGVVAAALAAWLS